MIRYCPRYGTLGIRAALEDGRLVSSGVTQTEEIEVECAVFGLAGLDTEHDRQIIINLVKDALEHLHIRVNHLLVENDGFAALLGATGGEPGILVIAGTGYIVYGINKQGVSARAGGWGHRVGDEGSGHWIGKQAIMAILKAEDGRGESTGLGNWILPYLGLQNAEDLFNWTYSQDYSVEKVGELSRFVSSAVAGEDQVAHRILKMAGEELFIGAKAVIEKLNLRNKPFKMILQGGVLQNDDLVRQMLIDQFREYAPLAELDQAKNEPIYGVMAMGLLHMETLNQR